jgi:hypothetical protein
MSLAIIASAFLVTSWILDHLFGDSRAVAAKAQVSEIVASFKSMYSEKPVDLGKWATDITGFAIINRIMPPETVLPNEDCTTNASSRSCYAVGPWKNSRIIIYSGQDYNAIGVVYALLDQNACMDFAEALIFPNTGLVIANINSTGFTFPPLGTAQYPDSASIASACSGNKSNQVQLLYSMK